ncbi:MAG: hypothetical protein M1426_05485 [Patescibacteria group bacterium]|nr:hypothetical protein [Patescibacteria group bacterium]
MRLINIFAVAIVFVVVLSLPILLSAQRLEEKTFSSRIVQKENQTEGQAGRVIQPVDTGQGMAAKIIERTSVFRGDPKKAFLLSLVLPGLGQKYVKSRKGVRFFGVVEAGLWTTMIGHKLSARWAIKNYKSFAADHALAVVEGKNSKYFVDIGNFLDIYRYNHKKQVERNTELLYPETSAYFWQWDSNDNRKRFRKMRIDADATKNRAIYFGAGIFINHMISAIHATLVAKQGKPVERAGNTSHFYLSISNVPESNAPLILACYAKQW